MQGAPSSEYLIEHVNAFLRAGNTGPAEPLLAALRRLAPRDPVISELTARFAIQRGDLAAASQVLEFALIDHPDSALLLRCRADLRHRQGELAAAAADAAQAVLLEPATRWARPFLAC